MASTDKTNTSYLSCPKSVLVGWRSLQSISEQNKRKYFKKRKEKKERNVNTLQVLQLLKLINRKNVPNQQEKKSSCRDSKVDVSLLC